MYHFSYFKEKGQGRILDFIRENPFAFLTGSTVSGEQVATQVPILLEERDGELYLQGHIMRNTDHHKAFAENPQALMVFTGPHGYVSATWYAHAKSASTWNYMSVHVKGTMNFMSDDELVQFMRKLTLHFEGGDEQSMTVYDNLPEEFLKRMMPAIIGFEVKVEKLENVFKLSQNRDEASYRNIIAKLEEQGGTSAMLAAEMQKRMADLFPPDAD